MARLVPARCPHCGAGVQIPPDAEWVTCRYCQGSSFIQRDSDRSRQPPPNATVIHVPASIFGARWVFAAPLAIVSVIAVGAFASSSVVVNNSPIVFRPPLLFDIDADGVDELVVQGTLPGSAHYQLRALDARTSETVWVAEAVGRMEDTGDRIALVGDTLLQVQTSTFRGFDARSGSLRYERALPERIEAVCESGERWVLFTIDEKFHVLEPSTGELTPGGEELRLAGIERPPCAPAWTTDGNGRRVRYRLSTPDPGVEGMYTASVLTFADDGDSPALVTGQNRSAGWRPMLAGVRGGATVWTADMAVDEPVRAKSSAPTGATIAAGRVYATYGRDQPESTHLVALSLESGERHWEVSVSEGNHDARIRANRHHVFVLVGGALHAFAAADGRRLWSITP